MLQRNYSPSHQRFQSSSEILAATHLKLITKWKQLWHDGWYSRITSKKSISFFMTTFSASLTNIRFSYLSHLIAATMWADQYWHLHHSDWINTDLHANGFARFPDFSHQPRLTKITCAWSWRFCEITPAVTEETNWYEQEIEKLFARFDKCQNLGENFVGKSGMKAESSLDYSG